MKDNDNCATRRRKFETHRRKVQNIAQDQKNLSITMGDLILQDNKYIWPKISSTERVSWNPSYFLDSCENKPHLRSSPELSSRGLGNELTGVYLCLLTAGRRFSPVHCLRKKAAASTSVQPR